MDKKIKKTYNFFLDKYDYSTNSKAKDSYKYLNFKLNFRINLLYTKKFSKKINKINNFENYFYNNKLKGLNNSSDNKLIYNRIHNANLPNINKKYNIKIIKTEATENISNISTTNNKLSLNLPHIKRSIFSTINKQQSHNSITIN